MTKNSECINDINYIEVEKDENKNIDLCSNIEINSTPNNEDIKNSRIKTKLFFKNKKKNTKGDNNCIQENLNTGNDKCDLSGNSQSDTSLSNKKKTNKIECIGKDQCDDKVNETLMSNISIDSTNITSNSSYINSEKLIEYNDAEVKKKYKDNSKKKNDNKSDKTSGASNNNNNNLEFEKDKNDIHKKSENNVNGDKNKKQNNEGENISTNLENNEINTKKKNKINSKKGGNKKTKNKNKKYLQNSWAFSFDKDNRKSYDQYMSNLTTLEPFNTIEKFYKNYKYMKSPSSIKEYYNIYLFKQSFKPLYEEYSNGFICIIKDANNFKNNIADLIWEKMVLLSIGEKFNLVDLSGIQLCIRENEIFFKIWMKNYSNYLKNILTKRLSELLDLHLNVSFVIKILSNTYFNRKNANIKDKTEKGKKYIKNKSSEYSSKREKLNKIKPYGHIINFPPYNLLGNHNIYKKNIDMNLYYLYNQNMGNNPYLYYPLNIPNYYHNGYPEYIYNYNLPINAENVNFMTPDIYIENKFVNSQTNGITFTEKKKKI
ncbi:eukaryotic translation initiation factor 4E, putative [Plasmodium berghei]|uniref:Eukaryotic translation initiation factor 4E, putative n=2 Tax=Plasmodium berghei TaxID=5821 RepID=A0A509ADB2_PLABA|nr:eukaryotic translation initiation factor 4E, putative [Plasmodium berghei ANKA]CXH85594.1 eukaryotic translation initiation factor 4E, putative [Plasmodium berghei]SCL89870.1 eukaryotic translation initiation factor 4E, putative [Plasmodium berghei]SCM15170.1 eukaryotic translation initiation factor 4E, putative [Plasmodium berghei]SCM16965.1 eukaryotic translation initiation factor 4E, putative [Plasmodium berghei]SCN21775.1 eukaryotic translation initiation factor 4E, putative [Plasmodium|eukprot:XP_034419746.1 eukaryotic translation initiation factor 4E, putative [Plasmodium berghei ANKA]